MIYSKIIGQSKPQTIHHIRKLCGLFQGSSFLDDEGELLCVASHDVVDDQQLLTQFSTKNRLCCNLVVLYIYSTTNKIIALPVVLNISFF